MRLVKAKIYMVMIVMVLMIMVMTYWVRHRTRPPLSLGPPTAPSPVDLPPGEPPKGGIMLLEGYGGQQVTFRMFCAMESAARANTDLPVTLVMTSSVVSDTPLLRELTTTFTNIDLLHLDAAQLFKDTPLEEWHANRGWADSEWPASHYNDALRWLLLWHYGGIYLDLDVVVLRSLSSLPNCTGLESGRWAAAGVLKFTPAHPLIHACLVHFATHFDGRVWGANGPELLTAVLKERCGLQLPSGRTPRCPDITVLPPRAFYPVPWWEWSRYVTEDPDLSRDLLSDPDVLVLHVWNKHTGRTQVTLDSQQPYARAAQAHCPITVAHAQDLM